MGIEPNDDTKAIAARAAWVDDVYREHCQRVFRACLRFAGGDRAWALDRTHDVFVRLIERADSVRAHDDPGGWLYRVAVNTCFMALRRQRVARRFAENAQALPSPSAPSAEAQARAVRAVSAVEQAIHDLPAEQRAVMVLMHLDRCTQARAAELLGVSQGQVSKLHKEAVTRLRSQDWDIADA